jgi:hypothetical protein
MVPVLPLAFASAGTYSSPLTQRTGNSMADDNKDDDKSPSTSDMLSASDMQGWLRIEKETLRIAMDERIREATAFVDAYAAGQLTEKQAEKKWDEYRSRWPDVANDDATQLRIEDAVQDAILGPPARPWTEFHEEQDRRWADLQERVKREAREKRGGSRR